jgi:hypothetical protein
VKNVGKYAEIIIDYILKSPEEDIDKDVLNYIKSKKDEE